jgi:hypothetical protein
MSTDPDNVDPFNDDFDRGGGFTPKLTADDSVVFVRKLAAEAKRYGMSIGLKNAENILPNVTDVIQFAVNEECSTYELGCRQYEPFLKTGKPVFHYEYVKVSKTRNGGRPTLQSVYPQWANLSTNDIQSYYCLRNSFGNAELVTPDVGRLFSTAIKALDLGGWVMYCDGTYGETPTSQTVDNPSSSTRGGGLGSLFGGRRGGQNDASDDDGRTQTSANPRPGQSIPRQAEEPNESSGGLSGLLGSWWPFKSARAVEKDKSAKFMHRSVDLGVREDLHRRFFGGV